MTSTVHYAASSERTETRPFAYIYRILRIIALSGGILIALACIADVVGEPVNRAGTQQQGMEFDPSFWTSQNSTVNTFICIPRYIMTFTEPSGSDVPGWGLLVGFGGLANLILLFLLTIRLISTRVWWIRYLSLLFVLYWACITCFMVVQFIHGQGFVHFWSHPY